MRATKNAAAENSSSIFAIRFVLCLWGNTIFLKCKETLTYIIQRNKKTHPHEHGDVFLNAYRHIGKNAGGQRLGYAVGQQVTDGYVGNKFDNIFPTAFFDLKRIVLIQKVADDTADGVIRSRGDPVAEAQKIVA